MLILLNKYNIKKEKSCFIKLLFFILLSLAAKGQTTNAKSPTVVAADSLFAISKSYLKNSKYDKALDFAHQSLAIYLKTENYRTVANNYNQIATVHFYKSELVKALSAFKKSKEFFTKANFKNGIASSTNNIGAMYYSMGNYSKALDHYKLAIEIHEELKNDKRVAGTTQNIGNIYYVLKDFLNAKVYYEKAEENHQKTKNTQALALVKSSLGRIYMEEKDLDTALSYFETSLQLSKEAKNKQVQSEVLYNLGKLYNRKSERTKAISYLKRSVKVAHEVENNLQKSTSLVALGNTYLKFKEKRAAIKSCSEGLELAKSIKSVSVQEEACKCLYDSYKAVNNPSQALLFNEQMYVLRDSLNIKQTSDKILNMKFEREMLLDSISHVEKVRKAELEHQKIVRNKEKQRNIFIVTGCFAIVIAVSVFSRLKFVKRSKARLQLEKDRSEHLLHNILPEEVAKELKEKGYVDAKDFETASILFTDFKSFTEKASLLTPQQLVEEINTCFKAFDKIIEYYQIEKIKTIGDAYMAAGGLPKPDSSAVKKTILAAITMQLFIENRKQENLNQNKPAFDMRIGIHVGPIVAGIVGVKKFQYDIWGDTVNIASRMESNGEVGKVNISSNTYELVKEEKELSFEYRGKITAKGKGALEMYFVTSDKASLYDEVFGVTNQVSLEK